MGRQNKAALPTGLRRLRDGQITVDVWYRDSSGRRRRFRRMLGPVTVAQAVAALAAARVAILEGRLGVGSEGGQGLAAAFAAYLDWAREHRPKSIRYREAARKHFLAFFGNVPLRTLTVTAVERYKRRRVKEVAPATVNLDLAAVKHLLHWCAVRGLVAESQAAAVRSHVELLELDNARERFLGEGEQVRLFLAAGEQSDNFRRLVIAAMNCGQRSADVRGLTWDRVNLAAGVILFVRGKARTGSRAKRGLIQINDSLRAVLEDARADRREGEQHVFLTRHRHPWTNNTVNREWLKACASAKLDDLRFHDLRHHFASILVQRGIPLQRVGAMLGHTKITTSERYAHLAPGADQATFLLDEGGEE